MASARCLGTIPEGEPPGAPGAGPARRSGRILGLVLGLAWGAAIVWVQLRLTWELVGVSGFARPPEFLSIYSLPPSHWAQLALPAVFLGRPIAPQEYWAHQATTAGEACVYVGIVPLILAFVGLAAAPRDRALRPWLLVAPLAMVLATMPSWWPDGFYYVLHIPGLGWFRAGAVHAADQPGPGLAGRPGPRRWAGRSRRGGSGSGSSLAVAFGGLAAALSSGLARDADYRAALGGGTIAARFAGTGLAWASGLAAIIAWRRGRLGAWAPVALAAIELGVLLFIGPIWWCGRSGCRKTARSCAGWPSRRTSGLVAGRLLNIPVRAGLTPAFPSMGITPPPPNYLLEAATRPPGEASETDLHWLRRFGVTHGIWSPEDDIGKTVVLDVIPDPVLDRLMAGMPRLHAARALDAGARPARVPPGVGGASDPRGDRLGPALHRALGPRYAPTTRGSSPRTARPGCRPRPLARPMSGAGTAARRSSSTTGRAS